jgi:hypothetical protein
MGVWGVFKNIIARVLGVGFLVACLLGASAGRADSEMGAVERLAFSIGRATDVISRDRAAEIADRIERGDPLPSDIYAKWQKLLQIAQYLVLMNQSEVFFSVGYEIETIHKEKFAFEHFKEGAQGIFGILAENIGIEKSRILKNQAHARDSKGRNWELGLEWARIGDDQPTGFELGSPPFFERKDLEQFISFVWRFGKSEWGQANNFTSGQQTYSLIPVGQQADSQMVARMAVNIHLLEAQFGPAISDLLGVQRWGGMSGNLVFRPLAFDHFELLQELKELDLSRVDLKDVHSLLFEKYFEKEFQIQKKNFIYHSRNKWNAEQRAELEQDLGSWNEADKKKWNRPWKYRDAQVKFNLENPTQTLVEFRMADWNPKFPERVLLETFLYQSLLARAWELSLKGETFALDIPKRLPDQTTEQYWRLLRSHSSCSVGSLFSFLGVKKADTKKLVQGKRFHPVAPGFKAYKDRMTFAFEIEAQTDSLVNLIVPRDPNLRVVWDRAGERAKVGILREMGFEFDGNFSENKRRILTTEFFADVNQYPFLSPDLHLETSGNWEIKSHLDGFQNLEQLSTAVKQMNSLVGEGYGMHMHVFIPDAQLVEVRSGRASEFVDYLERASLFMALRGYAEGDRKRPQHYLDSWSLDRFSPADLSQILDHLKGRSEIGNTDQKYHNIGFRPVEGGLDIEFRDLGDDYKYGLGLVKSFENALVGSDFGGIHFESEEALFMEFRDSHFGRKEKGRYTLVQAIEAKYPLTERQKDLLRKFQFEIYKPLMKDFMFFQDFATLEETPNSALDTAFVVSNFESNLAIPLLNFEGQSFLSSQDKKLLVAERFLFLERVFAILGEVEVDSRYAFLDGDSDFLYLADWLKRSTHESRPHFRELPAQVITERTRLLEWLVFRLRSEVVRFVQRTQVDRMVEQSLTGGSAWKSRPIAYKGFELSASEKAPTPLSKCIKILKNSLKTKGAWRFSPQAAR